MDLNIDYWFYNEYCYLSWNNMFGTTNIERICIMLIIILGIQLEFIFKNISTSSTLLFIHLMN